jgi:ferritin
MLFARTRLGQPLSGFFSRLKHVSSAPTPNSKVKLSPAVEELLNVQINMEAYASHYYLACASAVDKWGMDGTSSFMFAQATEERQHMVKLMRFVNGRGGSVALQEVAAPPVLYDCTINDLFNNVLEQEEKNTSSVNRLLSICLDSTDHISYQFVQWYAEEQANEEALIRNLTQKLALLKNDSAGIYCFDSDLKNLAKRQIEGGI